MRFALLLLVACGPDLSGEWAGDPTCDGTEFDTELTLVKISPGVFRGPIVFESRGTIPLTGLITEFEAEYDLELVVDGGKPQSPAAVADFVDVDCGLFTALGDQISDLCTDLGILDNVLIERTADLEDLDWDGGDILDFDSDRCQGKVERQ